MSAPAALEPVRESGTEFLVPRAAPSKGPKARTGVPFYNPAMRLARDISVAVCRTVAAERPGTLRVVDAMAATGARGLRIAREVPNVHVLLNDPNLDAIHLAKQNADRLGLGNVDIRLGRLEPLLADQSFDWVDIDPFGTPAPYLDFAVRAVSDGGVLAVTSTDKAALCGVYPGVCLRRYGSRPVHGTVMWEVAARILVGAAARAAGRRDRSIRPLLVHSTNHYVRAYLRVSDRADEDPSRAHGFAWMREDLTRGLADAAPKEGTWGGPLWRESLIEAGFAARAREAAADLGRDTQRRLDLLATEANAPPLYYTIDEFTRRLKGDAPPLDRLVERLQEAGHASSRTHFTPRGFKTTASPEDVTAALGRPF